MDGETTFVCETNPDADTGLMARQVLMVPPVLTVIPVWRATTWLSGPLYRGLRLNIEKIMTTKVDTDN